MATKKKRKNLKKPIQKSNKLVSTKWLLLILAVITFITFSPILQNEFLDFDDVKFIVDNPLVLGHIEGSPYVAAFEEQFRFPYYKPLVYVTWILEYQLFGLNPKVFHLTNLLIHIINVLLVFVILRTFLKRTTNSFEHLEIVAAFGALMFAIHPLKVESVAWAVERKDVLFSLFYLLGIVAYVRYLNKPNLKWMLWVAVAYLLSCLSKSHGITLVGILFLLDYLWKRPWDKKIILEKWPVFAVSILVLFLLGFIAGPTADYISSSHVAYAVDASLIYDPPNLANLPAIYKSFLQMNYRFWLFLTHLLLPIKMALVYPGYKLMAGVGMLIHIFPLLSVGLLFGVYRLYKSHPTLVFGLLFFAMSIAPVLVLQGSGTNFLSDRYTYISSLGLVFPFCFWLHTKWNIKIRVILMGVICVLLACVYF